MQDAARRPARFERVELVEQGREYCYAAEHKGVVPEILEGLLQERRDVKALIKRELDPAMKIIYDLRQKAIKVAANAFCE
jgi:DNA polymerase elongation subunit (family B)